MTEHITGFKAAVAAVLAALTALWGWFGWFILAWAGLMVLDYITGSAAACKSGAWSSSVAREGLWHKFGAIVAVLVTGVLDYVIGLMLSNIPVGDAALYLFGADLPAGGGVVHIDGDRVRH